MSVKRVLIVHENRLVSSFYREHLEQGGFAVDHVRSGEEALQRVGARKPDAVVIDPLTPGREACDVIRAWRADAATRELPVVALPGSRPPLIKAVQQAGATKVLSRSLNPPADLKDALQEALGAARTETVHRCVPMETDHGWLEGSATDAADAMNAMRHALHEATHEATRREALRNLLQQAHGLAEQLALFGQRPLFQFAGAMESLAFDLNRFPEQANTTALRTFGQGLDFAAVLLQEAQRRELQDPSTAQVLAIDDEDGARAIIMAAMGLVNLRSLAADSPSSAFSVLRSQTFDLIFLDVGLPEMNGFEICSKIRSAGNHQRTPIVFLTGMTTFQNRVQSSLSGGNDFVGKPFNIPELGLKALIWVMKGQNRLS